MKTIKQLHADKSTWGKGPWQKEPDKVQWQDKATGLPCLIVRAPMTGALCGYVGVTKGHPYFRKSYKNLDVDVHGGLTFTGNCHGLICHTVEDGEDDNVWWLGFDCAHGFDVMPAMNARLKVLLGKKYEKYRDLKYVKQQVRKLAQQLKKK